MCDRIQDKEGENEVNSGDGCAVVDAGGGGYNKEKPPEDDCCPICFDAFSFPCKTSCGHWFCCSCILRYWRYTTSIKQCKCPMCGCIITKLVPEKSLLNQQGEKAVKVLKDVHQYNHLNAGGWYGLYLKALALPLVIWREYFIPRPQRISQAMRYIGMLMAILYDVFDLHFYPNGKRGIIVLFEILGCALVLLLLLHEIWCRWQMRRRLRRLNQAAGFEEMG